MQYPISPHLSAPEGLPALAFDLDLSVLRDPENGSFYCHDARVVANVATCARGANRSFASTMQQHFASVPVHKLARAYAATATHLDHEFGRLLATLDELGLAARSVVVFTGE